MKNKYNENETSKELVPDQAKAERQKKITTILFAILAVLLVLMFIFVFFCSPAMIDGESMQPTLHDGQIVMISRVNKNPQLDDIVIYKKPGESKKVIKRVVGVAGDTFYFSGNAISASAHIIKEGTSTSYSLSNEQYYFLASKFNNKKHSGKYAGYHYFTLLEDEIFTMGDNYNNSVDGRNYGPIKVKDLIGIKI